MLVDLYSLKKAEAATHRARTGESSRQQSKDAASTEWIATAARERVKRAMYC